MARLGYLRQIAILILIFATIFGHPSESFNPKEPSKVSSIFDSSERRLSTTQRQLSHMHLQGTPLYGNSTDFMYFYVTIYIGSHR